MWKAYYVCANYIKFNSKCDEITNSIKQAQFDGSQLAL